MINTIEDLKNIVDKKLLEEQKYNEEYRVCVGSSCKSIGSVELKNELENELEKKGLKDSCRVKGVGCRGLCANGTLVSHIDNKTKKETLYEKITTFSVEKNEDYKDKICDTSIPFFTKQKKIILENVGAIDPDDIEDYIAFDGYLTLFETIGEKTPEDVIKEIKDSGLRGRGGGGFAAGLKWETVSKVVSEQKYIICNGDEGDPGAFMDRAIMEANPHIILEAMAIAGYACGANQGYIYVRAEYPMAVEKLSKAIKQANRYGVIGNNIAHSNFSFNIEIRLGSGAFVCGEATALVASIEGNRGNPRQKPPHLGNHGLWGNPTLLNNVETFANVVAILKNGATWFKNIGTKNSSGTKIFALTGHIKNAGLVEVSMGITLRELIYDIGGGVPDGKKLKAIQTGGPSGGCIPERLLDIELDYDSLKSVGTIMGSGGLIVIDESSSMVEVAHFFMDFCKSESCGKCTPCRVGTTQLTNLLEKFIKKEASRSDFELLKNMCETVKETSLCGLGQSAPNPVISTMRHFEAEYLAGIKND